MRRICFIFLLALSYTTTTAQKTGNVKGVAVDTASKERLSSATITLLRKKDSSLVSFTMTDNNGQFELTGIEEGEYRLLITHVNYYNTTRMLKIDSEHKNIDLGTLIMNDRSKVLSEVVVTSEAPPVTLVGDTIQYNAGSFKTQPNASVEDLLKKLPGVKVEKDGTVKAQGEKVQKVLVDGKEFFGNDPKIATKNLPADAIDKVQVFDKLSDQAQLTGFDDGNSEKTINLKLKRDKKKGMFGKLNAGGGTDGRYEGKFNVNSFKGARQMSAIGMGNNTNADGFSFMDILNFTGALNQLKNGGNLTINVSPNDPIAGLLGGSNSGINTTFGGGINYNNLIGNKTDFQSNYFYSRFNPNRQSIIQRQYFSPANIYRQNSFSDNLNNSHRLNFSIDYRIDSLTSLKISPSLSYQKTTNKSLSDYVTSSENDTRRVNDGNSANLTNNEGYNLNTNFLLRRKFKKRGRTLSLNILTSLNNNDGDGSLKSITDFYDQAGSFLHRDSVNQKNINQGDLTGYNARLVYTEPVFKKSLVEFSLEKSNTKNTSSKTTYDYNQTNGKFDSLNNLLSNDYNNTYGYSTAGLKFRKQTKKYNYSAGLSWQQSTLEGKIIENAKDSLITKSFTNLLPTARFQYFFSRFKNILINYTTSTNQPTVTQLQPVPDNSNPLYIKLGNPDLKQELIHLIRLNASFVSPFKNRNLFVFLTMTQTQNKIVNYDRITSLGIDYVTPVNVNGTYNINGNISWGFPVHFLKGSLSLSSTFGYDQNKQLFSDTINKIETNKIKTLAAGPELRVDMSPAESLNLSITAGISYSKSQYSIQTTRSSQYLNQEYSAQADWQLIKGVYFSTDFNYIINGQHAQGFNAKIPLWNASISKQILPLNRGELKFSIHDILNQNTGISRSTNQNYIEDTREKTLRRFFLLSFTYSLTKAGSTGEGSRGVKFMTR